jgi:hypothetical protein
MRSNSSGAGSGVPSSNAGGGDINGDVKPERTKAATQSESSKLKLRKRWPSWLDPCIASRMAEGACEDAWRNHGAGIPNTGDAAGEGAVDANSNGFRRFRGGSSAA